MNKEQIVAIIQRGYFTDGDLADALLAELAKVSDPVADGFNGDTPQLISSINALLELDAENALVPHGVGGHARSLLTACASRLKNTYPLPQPNLEVVGLKELLEEVAKPVAEVIGMNLNYGSVLDNEIPTVTKLFTHPPAPSVPDGLHIIDCGFKRC